LIAAVAEIPSALASCKTSSAPRSISTATRSSASWRESVSRWQSRRTAASAPAAGRDRSGVSSAAVSRHRQGTSVTPCGDRIRRQRQQFRLTHAGELEAAAAGLRGPRAAEFVNGARRTHRWPVGSEISIRSVGKVCGLCGVSAVRVKVRRVSGRCREQVGRVAVSARISSLAPCRR
jgi:hypothetical protein